MTTDDPNDLPLDGPDEDAPASEQPGATSYTTGDPGVDAVLADLGPMAQQLAADAEAREPLDVDAALELLTAAHQRLADRLSGLD
ncbi:hypothetical protein ATK17_1502 [Branchiibius hedensis]|uniref:Uncharacterized protein n=1 Tax=Branchiibius hedensis TaxID=672460 RepID=A0A2Y8ZSB9_9MICO|nr:hypothetical protein [Branchiibius hedensis]PWJ25385.1 hypothetical protein ATK17_1502 [Branchiibius hedensis]SSA34198.1 hypothetical protein SAMN04489750_1502 [Branchiibius hedensis]